MSGYVINIEEKTLENEYFREICSPLSICSSW